MPGQTSSAHLLRGSNRGVPMKIFIPSPLRSYTKERAEVEANGTQLTELLSNLDRKYKGLRFRMIDEQDQIRPHIKIFVNREQVHSLHTPLRSNDEILIICALSGG